ncbi:efflux transporter periplasmic adaptor subunit [Verrucomicrobia bacterium LW23]|nr:efflux transporter periplasmic adaptor subunit [Verrucomicrobia bacterium LW23]
MVPPTARSMKSYTSFHLFALVSTLSSAMLLVGCSEPKKKAELPPPTVTITKPIEREVTDTQEFTGTITARDTVQIRARVSGYMDKVAYKEGQEVKAGDLLFVIDQRPFKADLDKAKAQLAEAESKEKLAKVDFDRAQELFKQNVISAQEFDTKSANYASAVASKDTNKALVETANLNLIYTTVTAPVGGLTAKANITLGNLVTTSDVLTTIVPVDPIYVSFNVDERTLQRYRESNHEDRTTGNDRASGTAVRVGLATEKDYPYEAKIDYVSNQLDPGTGNFAIRAVLDNKSRIFVAGYFARVLVPMSKPGKALLVPERALGSMQGKPFLYVLRAGNKVDILDKLDLGQLTSDGYRVIKSGVAPDDDIIVDGILSVRPGVTVKPETLAQEAAKQKAAEGQDAPKAPASAGATNAAPTAPAK